MRQLPVFRLVAFIAVALTFLAVRNPAAGATFTVNTTADTADANAGNGTCSDAVGGCSLRAAIMEANALPGEDTIGLPAGVYTLSRRHGDGDDDIALNGDLDINPPSGDGLTIIGEGSANTIIDGGGIGVKVVEIISGAAEITGVTIQNGSWSGDGGGILNWGSLNLTDSLIRSNRTTGSSGAGGGAQQQGKLEHNE